MAVTVLIRRELTPMYDDRLRSLYQKMNEAALKQEGYLGSQVLKRADKANEMLVISRWKHVDEWTKWLISSERRVLQEQIDSFTIAETKFEIYDE